MPQHLFDAGFGFMHVLTKAHCARHARAAFDRMQ